jgi:hypothetical protein
VIILDTCVLTEQQRTSPIWELLYALRTSGTQRVTIPEMVLVELLAQRQRRYEATLDKARNSYDTLWKLQFSPSDGSEHWPAVDTVEQHVERWEALYRRTFEVLPLTLEAAREGLWREAQRRKPAKASGKEGSRDSVIWVTVLQEAKQAPDRTVHFVTTNSNDFGEKTLHPDLAAEVAEASVTVEYLSDLNKVLAEFTERRPLPHDDARLYARISSPMVTDWMNQFIPRVSAGQFEASEVDFDDEAPFVEWRDFEGWISQPAVEILGWRDEVEYVAGDVSRIAATLHVCAAGFARRLNLRLSAGLAAFVVDVRVVFGEDTLTVLSVDNFRPPEDAEEGTALATAQRAARSVGDSLWTPEGTDGPDGPRP